MSTNITHVTDASFEADVLKSGETVLVDYWAEWCGPCKMIAPVLEECATSYAGKIKIAKMDVDANQEVPAKYGIRGIPTLIVFKGGQEQERIVGAVSREVIAKVIDKYV